MKGLDLDPSRLKPSLDRWQGFRVVEVSCDIAETLHADDELLGDGLEHVLRQCSGSWPGGGSWPTVQVQAADLEVPNPEPRELKSALMVVVGEAGDADGLGREISKLHHSCP